MESKIKALLCEVGCEPKVIEYEDTLENMQELVGGYIEAITLDDDGATLWCNEEGKYNGMLPNRPLYDSKGNVADILYGNIFITGSNDEGETISLTEEQIKKYSGEFANYVTTIDLI